jgi:hypothetical protein
MNQIVKPVLQGDMADILLADVAIRVQLSPTNYSLAVSRANVLSEWIDRPESPLHGRVTLTYAQGSMAYNATIARCLRTDEFDIDIIAQIIARLGMTAKQVLDELYEAVRGEPGCHYYKMVERRNRCVTVHYADGMHIDITPAMLAPERSPRTSLIFNHKPEDKSDQTGYALWANPYGFAEWFKVCTPATEAFARAYMVRVRKWAETHEVRADMETVPEQKPPHEKSMAVIALQLLKRNRNVRYDGRPGRRPPSVLLAKLTADAALPAETLLDQLLRVARYVRDTIQLAHEQGRLISVTNPTCVEDVFTDRWPASARDQEVYLSDLGHLIAQLYELQRPDCGLPEMQTILSDLFGETPTLDAVEAYVERLGGAASNGSMYQERRTGRIDVVRSGLAAPAIAGSSSANSFAAPSHTNFGSEPPPE